jgi:hypothetical protein
MELVLKFCMIYFTRSGILQKLINRKLHIFVFWNFGIPTLASVMVYNFFLSTYSFLGFYLVPMSHSVKFQIATSSGLCHVVEAFGRRGGKGDWSCCYSSFPIF